ncbi:MAG: cupin domain-containing protein [Patescibacteria group bacterium]
MNIKNLITYSENGILSKVILKSEKMDITLFSMAEATEISEHTSTKQGFVYVIEGKGIFTLEGENITMEPGVFISMQENMVHSLKAEQNTSFLLSLVN